MGNQQMAYSSNQQPPPSVEDPNEWYDSVSDVEEHKQNSPENNVVVNGILDEFIDSLFESKLANSPNEALTGQNLPEDQQHNINQTRPITYDDVSPNWKGVDIRPESDGPDRLSPSNFRVPPTSDHIVREDGYLSKESEIKSIDNISNTHQETISESSNETVLCKENGRLFALQQTTNENIGSLKELCLKSDSMVPLPCPEDCEVFRDSTANENIKAFELTPKDVQTINQSGRFCEVFRDPKVIDSFQVPLGTIDKYARDNRDDEEDIPRDSGDIDGLSTSTIIKAGEAILEKAASYLEQIASNSDHKKEDATKRPIASGDVCDQINLGEHEKNICLATRQTATTQLNDIMEQHKHEGKLFNPNALEHLEVHLPDELAFPSNNIRSCQETPLEDITSSNKTLDQIALLSAVDSEHSQDRRMLEDIQKPIITKESECDAIRTKQDTFCTSDLKFIGQVGGIGEIPNYNTINATLTSATDIRQDDTKRIPQDDHNIRELLVISEGPHSIETRDPTINSAEEKSISSCVNDNSTIKSSAISTDAHSSNVTEESFQNSIDILSKPPVDVLNDEPKSEKTANVTHCDNDNHIPSINELSNDSVSLLVEFPSHISETNSPALPKDPVTLTTKLLDDTEKPLEKQTECLPQNTEAKTNPTSDRTVCEDDYLTRESEVKNLTNNANGIPSIQAMSNTSAPLLVEFPSCNSETHSPVLPKDPVTLTKLLEDTEKYFEKETECLPQSAKTETKSIENSDSVTENLIVSAPDEVASKNMDKDVINNIVSAPFIPLVDIKCVGTESPVSAKDVEVKASDYSSNPSREFPTSPAPLLGVDERSAHHINDSTSPIPPKDPDSDISSLEEVAKFKSFEKGVSGPSQNEGGDRKFSDVCSQMEVGSSVTENVSPSTPSNSNDVPSVNINKETPKNTKCTPRKSSIGVLNVKRKSFSSETEKHVEIKNKDKINCVASKDEALNACTSFPEKENRPPPHCSPAVPPVVSDMTCTPVEGKGKCQPSGREQVGNRQHKESRRKSNDVCPQMEKLENISSNEPIKEPGSSLGAAKLPESKQYRDLYEEGNICDLDEVINQFRHRHNSDNTESYSKLDKRKDMLDKFNIKKPTSDKRKNSGKNTERSNFQTTGGYKREPGVPEFKNKNVEDIPVCLDRHECKTSAILSQNPENILPKDGIVNFRGIITGEGLESFGFDQQNGPKNKCADTAKERAKMDVITNSGAAGTDDKKERMPELKPETLKSLIADLSLSKSTADVGCNTVEDWTKKDNSKAEADWLKERKKLIGRITDLHQTQNSTKFIVKELIYLVTSWMEGKDKDNVDLQETRQKLMNERDQALEDLRSVEESFYELHRRYEKTKKLIEDYKKNEDILKRQKADGEEKLQQHKQMFDHLVKHSEDKLEQANSEILNLGKSKESEMAVLTAQLRKAEMKANSLEKALEQKVRENTELSSICEDLITKCGRK